MNDVLSFLSEVIAFLFRPLSAIFSFVAALYYAAFFNYSDPFSINSFYFAFAISDFLLIMSYILPVTPGMYVTPRTYKNKTISITRAVMTILIYTTRAVMTILIYTTISLLAIRWLYNFRI